MNVKADLVNQQDDATNPTNSGGPDSADAVSATGERSRRGRKPAAPVSQALPAMSESTRVHTGTGDGGAQRSLTVSRPDLLVEGSDRDFRQLVHDTLAFAARIQEVRSRLGALIGLSGAQYTILVAVAHLQGREGGVGVNLLAEHLHLSGAFVTIEVNKLVAADLVTKEVNPEDRRRVLLTITAKAHQLLDELTAVQRPANDALFACLSAADFHAFRHMVAELVQTGDRTLKLLDYLAPDGTLAGAAARLPPDPNA